MLLKPRQSCLATILLAILFLSTVSATEIGNGLDLGGQMRWRMEFDGKDFNNGSAMNEISLLRIRVNLKVTAIENAVVYFQIQDSRNLGVNSAGLANDNNLGVHQGYIKLKNLFSEEISLQLGRFESPYGRHRLMGNVGWHNVGRSFDGVKLSHKGESHKTDVFVLKVDERAFLDSLPSHKDHNLYGIYGTFLQDRLDVFVLYDLDVMKAGDNYDLARHTIGSSFKNKLESGLGYEFDAAIQTGYRGAEDISAYMIAGDLYYSPKHKIMFIYSQVSKIGIGFDITSGDDPETANKTEAFDNLYYTGHKFRGYMDYFIGTTIPPGIGDLGLMDIVLRSTIKPCAKGSIEIDIHHFRTMEDHVDATDTSATPKMSKAIGQEIDITFKRKIQEGLGFQGGISAFLASDEWIDDADPALWIYLMLTAGF